MIWSQTQISSVSKLICLADILLTQTIGGLSQYFIFGIHRVLKRVARSNELLDSITVDQSHLTSTLFLTNTQTAGI